MTETKKSEKEKIESHKKGGASITMVPHCMKFLFYLFIYCSSFKGRGREGGRGKLTWAGG